MVYGFIFKSGEENTESILREIGGIARQLIEKTESKLDIKNKLPLWINQREENLLTEFVQAYYDWLYNESGYELSSESYPSIGLRKLLDLEKTPVNFLKHFLYTYVPDFPLHYVGLTAGPPIIPCNSNGSDGDSTLPDCENVGSDTTPFIRDFIPSVKLGLYQRKGREEAYKYLLTSLFGATASDVEFFYPKIKILRLNGGNFEGFEGDSGMGGMGGSYLSSDFKLQDSYWYQDFSYVLKAALNQIDPDTGLPIYYDIMNKMLHPAGIKGFFEKTEDDYIPPDDYDSGFIICEKPILGNYFPYRVGGSAGKYGIEDLPTLIGVVSPSIETIALCQGCSGGGFTFAGTTGSGWTYGIGWATGASGGISAEYNIPTYTYPSWSDGISGEDEIVNFGDILIGSFVYLCDIEDSLNIGITGCTAYGESTACWGT